MWQKAHHSLWIMWQKAHHSLWIMWQKAHHSLWIIGCDVSKHSRCVWASRANYSLCLASDSRVLQASFHGQWWLSLPGTESHHGASDTPCVKQRLCLKVVRRFHKRWRLFINSAAKVRFRSAPETSRVTGAEMNFARIPVAIHQRPLPIIPCLKEGEIYQRGSTQSSPWVRSFSRRRSADRQRKGASVPSSYRQDQREQTGSVFLLHNHYGLRVIAFPEDVSVYWRGFVRVTSLVGSSLYTCGVFFHVGPGFSCLLWRLL